MEKKEREDQKLLEETKKSIIEQRHLTTSDSVVVTQEDLDRKRLDMAE
jgi:hypothetical protein